MYAWLKILAILIVLYVGNLAVRGFSCLNQHLIIAIDRYGDEAIALEQQTSRLPLSPLVDKLTALFVEIERPCKGPGDDPNSCGVLANVKKVAIDTRHAVITTQLQVQATQPLLAAAANALTTTTTHLNGTADAATGFLETSREAMDQLNDDKIGISPVMASYLNIGNQMNDLLRRKAVEQILDHVAGITGSADHMLQTGDQVETKLTSSYLHPSKNPWVRTGNAVKPYAPLAVKSLSCWLVPGSCF